jgi:fused signal recognition particle receptor
MTYAIIAVAVLVVIVLFILIARAPGDSQKTIAEPKQTPYIPAKTPSAVPPAATGSITSAPTGPPPRHPDAESIEPARDVRAPATDAAVPATSESRSTAPSPRDVAGIRKGLAKARAETGFLGRLATLFAGKKSLDPTIADQVEEILLSSDVGVATTHAILERLRSALDRHELSSSQAVWDRLRSDALRILAIGGPRGGRIDTRHRPTVVFMVGVNGVGKTTTIGKLATKLKAEGKSVVLAAGDTFRAAAVQQLEVWGKRVGCEVVKGKEGADPGAVIFDAIQRAKETGIDIVLADTAGRLQTKAPLMDELKKIARTMQKAMEGAPHETLLVLDGTNGQNATSQAKMFQEAIPLTGIVLTKLDGTAKGGVILGICDELKIPVRYVGLGERAEDLREFVADEFVEALFGASAEETAAA